MIDTELENLKGEYDALQESHSKLEQALEDAQETIKELEEKINTAKETFDDVASRCRDILRDMK